MEGSRDKFDQASLWLVVVGELWCRYAVPENIHMVCGKGRWGFEALVLVCILECVFTGKPLVVFRNHREWTIPQQLVQSPCAQLPLISYFSIALMKGRDQKQITKGISLAFLLQRDRAQHGHRKLAAHIPSTHRKQRGKGFHSLAQAPIYRVVLATVKVCLPTSIEIASSSQAQSLVFLAMLHPVKLTFSISITSKYHFQRFLLQHSLSS